VAKRRRALPARTHVYEAGSVKPGFSRKRPPPAPRRSRSIPRSWLLIGGALAVAALLIGGAYALGFIGRPGSATQPTAIAGVACPERPPTTPAPGFSPAPPAATPLANPPAQPAGDGTRAIIEVAGGCIVMELYNQSSPVAAQNFINLAEGGFYDGVVFHRIVPGFMIQGGDPQGTGTGGPGYGIPDEAIVGEYTRGTLAMARTNAPNSQGSQFFIVVEDSPHLANAVPGYAIFGRVVSGMELVDQIVSMPNANNEGGGGRALDPVEMIRVTIDRP
jgi:peptidyl-prolyl cis-trans isomerase B (cyclophilin B)